ncbi:hypothetical protein SISNIDRAFT_550372 [Sistotremastrum niveocremeum HHB9708]|uniref:Uncharacterized protein n=1 Tax=Sistotremastrum niveocremeum HHB9708 TaxID=1314777 RepID=A0A164TG53_9AGAM|nr:hypothetical protein SISNIDRAFT_550372 [Sistotremastrum niveocremeum HHB9708]
MQRSVLFLLVLLRLAAAQTATVVDADGETVVEVQTIDPLQGLPTTIILQTLTGTTTTATSLTTPDPGQEQQGPVGVAPTTTNFGPAPPTTYKYTTTNALGESTVIHDTFTPVPYVATSTVTPSSGTVWDLSDYQSSFGTSVPTSRLSSNALSLAWKPPISIAGSLLLATLGGMFLLA